MKVQRTDPYNRQVSEVDIPIFRYVVFTLLGLFLCVALLIGGCSGAKSYGRWQKRNDAKNAVQVTHILIRKAQQQAQINRAQIAATVAEAQKRYQEAVGIRRAQDEIQKTLTPLYVQHEAIQAQERIASSGKNNTIIYTPSGSNGVPLVQQPPLQPLSQLNQQQGSNK